jgi:hypothetical protein
MSKHDKQNENMNEHNKYDKSCCESIKAVKEEHNIYKSLCEMYEKENDDNFLTTRGQNFIREAKKAGIILIAAYALYTLYDIKKTVDNIPVTVHNASSVTTK